MGKFLLSALLLAISASTFAEVDSDLEKFFKELDPTYKTKAEREVESVKKEGYFARTITIDTRDQESCLFVQEGLKRTRKIPYKENICEYSEENPYSSVVILMKADEKYDQAFTSMRSKIQECPS